jgi:hypothetical protein
MSYAKCAFGGSDGYMPVKPSPVDSIKEMCKYGDGIGASVFRECGHAR